MEKFAGLACGLGHRRVWPFTERPFNTATARWALHVDGGAMTDKLFDLNAVRCYIKYRKRAADKRFVRLVTNQLIEPSLARVAVLLF